MPVDAESVLAEVDDDTRRLLVEHHFDPETFAAHLERVRAGRAGPESNWVRGPVLPAPPEALDRMPEPGTERWAELAEVGERAIAAGQVGVVLLAGGMATRFGGVVKATVEVLDGLTFCDLKLAGAAAAASRTGGRVPVLIMCSFATAAAVAEAVAAHDTVPVEVFTQGISLRLTPEGELFRTAAGRPSPYAPGHGDLPWALEVSGALRRFRDAGGRWLVMSNIDNLAATLEPVVVGHHIVSGADVTVELVDAEPGDTGGAPALVDGRLRVVEGPCFPPDVDRDAFGVFSTNSFVFTAGALRPDLPFTWVAVTKEVEGRPALQFERIINEVTATLPTSYLVVPRSGPGCRFLPIKTPGDLERHRPVIRDVLTARGVL